MRHILFESVPNFRDLGGYRTRDDRAVAWRRLFRSAARHKINARDMARLKADISPRPVIDLRSPKDSEKEVLLLEAVGARYYPIPFSTWPWPGPLTRPEATADRNATNMGEIYLYRPPVRGDHSAPNRTLWHSASQGGESVTGPVFAPRHRVVYAPRGAGATAESRRRIGAWC